MTRTRVALARLWGVAPGALRDVTLQELEAMAELVTGNGDAADG